MVQDDRETREKTDMMIIETERLLLREYTADDFDALYEILSDPETMRHYPAPFDAAQTRRWIDWNLENYAKYGYGLWAVVLKETGQFIGDCGITIQCIDGEMLPEIGYHIHKKFQRQGFAKEAARAVRDWGFRHTQYDTFYSYMKYTNLASQATAAANGMRKVKEYPDPKNTISCAYAITRPEWERSFRTDFRIVPAAAADTDAVLRLYREQIGRAFCPWNMYYPGPETIENDLSRDALFVMKNEAGGILAAISVEEDEDMDRLECWDPSLQPAGEYARLAVTPAYQNRGLARKMVSHVLDVLKERGFKSVHILVARDNLPAIRSYARFGFRTAGECEMYDQHFLCYEKKLD